MRQTRGTVVQCLKILIGFTCLAAPALANEQFENKKLGLDVVGGFPQLLGVEMTFMGWDFLTPGVGYGTAPINSILNKAVPLPVVPVNFGLADTYNLYPKSTYSVTSYEVFFKYYFPKSGFMLDLLISSVAFGANVSADLKDENTGVVSNSLVTGSAAFTQIMLGLAVGYQLKIYTSLFIELAVGASFPFPPIYSVSLGGSATGVVGLVPGGTAALDSAISQVKSTLDSAVATYRATIKVLPIAFLNIGFAF